LELERLVATLVSVGKTDRVGKGLSGRCSRIVTDQLGEFLRGRENESGAIATDRSVAVRGRNRCGGRAFVRVSADDPQKARGGPALRVVRIRGQTGVK